MYSLQNLRFFYLCLRKVFLFILFFSITQISVSQDVLSTRDFTSFKTELLTDQDVLKIKQQLGQLNHPSKH